MVDDETRDVRKLGHDLRNHLFAIQLGLQALELQEGLGRFAELIGKIRGEVTAAEKVADALQGMEPHSPKT